MWSFLGAINFFVILHLFEAQVKIPTTSGFVIAQASPLMVCEGRVCSLMPMKVDNMTLKGFSSGPNSFLLLSLSMYLVIFQSVSLLSLLFSSFILLSHSFSHCRSISLLISFILYLLFFLFLFILQSLSQSFSPYHSTPTFRFNLPISPPPPHFGLTCWSWGHSIMLLADVGDSFTREVRNQIPSKKDEWTVKALVEDE